jgi:hypothetical protein
MRCPNAYFERRLITCLVCILRHTRPSMGVHTSFRVSPLEVRVPMPKNWLLTGLPKQDFPCTQAASPSRRFLLAGAIFLGNWHCVRCNRHLHWRNTCWLHLYHHICGYYPQCFLCCISTTNISMNNILPTISVPYGKWAPSGNCNAGPLHRPGRLQGVLLVAIERTHGRRASQICCRNNIKRS